MRGTVLPSDFPQLIREKNRPKGRPLRELRAPCGWLHVCTRARETPLATFFASGLLALGAKLGPFLWPLPPNFKYDPERLAAFFKLLPRDHESAADLAATATKNFGVLIRKWRRIGRFATRWKFVTKVFARRNLLRCCGSMMWRWFCADIVEWPRLMDVTSDFMYCRLHGSGSALCE
jgi:uncharacterized protein YecE (DUF72 family)